MPQKPASLDRVLQGLIAGGLIAISVLVWDSIRSRVVNVGDTAPEFNITVEDGRMMTRSSFGGKVLVLNFWASWCPPCAQETPSMEALHRLLGKDGVVVLGISHDKNVTKYKNFLNRFNVTFPTERDPEARVADFYGTYRLPETYVIDRNGKVVEKVVGGKNWADPAVVKFLRSLL